MRYRTRQLALAAGLALSWVTHANAFDDAQLQRIVDGCARYERLTQAAQWAAPRSIDPHDQAMFEPVGCTATPIEVQGQPALRVAADGDQGGRLHIQRDVHGAFAIEVEARTVSRRLCDISLFMDDVNEGPGFQFGGIDNTRNALWTDARHGAPNERFGVVRLDDDVKIQRNRWHRVRLEVIDGMVRGMVDGRRLGATALSEGYNAAPLRQPMVYCHGSTLEIRRIDLFEQRRSTGIDTQAAWAEALGERTQGEVARALQQIADRLDDPAWARRQRAQAMLVRAGSLARPIVAPLVEAGDPEQRWRARQILRRLPADPPTRTDKESRHG